MGMIIRSEMFPLRLKVGEKGSMELILDIQNEDDRKKMVSIHVELPPQMTFSSVGRSQAYEKYVDGFRPLATARLKIPVHMSRDVEIGSHPGKIIVREHFHEFGTVEKEFKKEILFRIYR